MFFFHYFQILKLTDLVYLLVLENSTSNKQLSIFVSIEDTIQFKNITRTFKPQNYTIPLDFNQEELLYIYKEPLNSKNSKKEIIKLQNLITGMLLEFEDISGDVRMGKIVSNGIIYVKGGRSVYYYDNKNKTNIFLFSCNTTIISLSVNKDKLICICKNSSIFYSNYITKEVFIRDKLVSELNNIRNKVERDYYFEMAYPYFSILKENIFAFSTDFGVIVIDLNSINQKDILYT